MHARSLLRVPPGAGACAASAGSSKGSPQPRPASSLSTLSLPNTTVTLAQPVAAGAFTPPAGEECPAGPAVAAGAAAGRSSPTCPAFCRVQATLKPSSDSDIKMELWLPAAGWNGKFRGTGNGGLGGGAGVNAGQLAAGVRAGYAAAGNNTGHDGDSSYAMDHPEKIKDFGYRSAHEMTVASKGVDQGVLRHGAEAR